jgi:hypothetical protein
MKANPRHSRRHFLRAAGGLGLALPLFESLGARAQEQAYSKRLVTMYNPNGTVLDAWWPSSVLSPTEFTLGELLLPLQSHQSRLIQIRGLELKVGKTGPGGPHQKGIGGLFTGSMLQAGTFEDGCGSQAGWADGISIDQEVANLIGRDTPLKSLELGVRAVEADVQSRIAYAGPGQPLPPLNDPLATYLRLFGGVVTGDDAVAQAAHRISVVSAVSEQAKQLSARLGHADKNKLDQHLTLLSDIERRLKVTSGAASCGIPAIPPDLGEDDENDMPAIMKLQLDLLAVAFACDITRVASLQISTALNRIRFPWLGSMGAGHTLSHAGPSNAEARVELIARAKWHSEQLAYLMDRLAEIQEGDGTVLDRTLIVWGNEVSQGNTHAHTDMPFLLAGGADGALAMGRYLEYPGMSHQDLLVSILNAMDVETTTFGQPEFCTGALPGFAG